MRLRRWFLRMTIPIQKVLQKIHRPEYRIRGDFYYVSTYSLKNGDVLLSREDWKLTNWFIPGFWSHAAIVSHDWVIEAVEGGVRAVRLAEWFLTKDYVLVLRLPDAERAGILAEDELGRQYDYTFSMGSKEFYCSELVYKMLRKVVPTFRLNRKLKHEIIPDDFAGSLDLQIVMDSREFYST